MTYFKDIDIRTADSPSIDAFGKLRVSNPTTLFDSKQLHDSQPLKWDDSETSGSGTTSTHSTINSSTTIGVAATTAGTRVRQTFMRFNYQPAKSQQVFMTFLLDKSGGGTGINRFLGLYDGNDGIRLRDEEGTYKFEILKNGSVTDSIAQSSWNLDTLDGSGKSGFTLDFSKSAILTFDFEWLGVGRVRIGFVIDGLIVYAHEFLNTNIKTSVYMSTPNLPLRYEIQNDGTGAASELEHICSSVISEGGSQELGKLGYISTDGTHVDANTADTLYAIIGMRLKSTHLDAVIKQVQYSLLAETSDAFEYVLLMNPTVAGTFTYSGLTNYAIEYATGATANTVTGGTAITGGFASSAAGLIDKAVNAVYIGSAIDGTPDELVLCARPLSSNLDIQGSITFRELS